MINTLIGRKIDQTQKFLEDGKRVPVTLIAVSDNAVLQVKTQDTDAYTAVQLGFGTKKKPTKAATGHAKKAGFDKVSAVVREVRVADGEEVPTAGEAITLDQVFAPGDIVSVTGISKGKGWAGVVKRHGFRGGPKTHGQSDRLRAPGSIGQTTTPGRVYKGKRMAGRMGSDQVTLPNLTVVGVDTEKKILLVTGLVPGHKESIVTVTKTGTRKKFAELIEEKVKREARVAAEAEAARIEAEKAAKIAEEEAAKAAAAAPKVEEAPTEEAKSEETPVATAEETVTDATETVSEAAEAVEAPAEETKEEQIEKKAEEVAIEEEVKETEASEEKAEEAVAGEEKAEEKGEEK